MQKLLTEIKSMLGWNNISDHELEIAVQEMRKNYKQSYFSTEYRWSFKTFLESSGAIRLLYLLYSPNAVDIRHADWHLVYKFKDRINEAVEAQISIERIKHCLTHLSTERRSGDLLGFINDYSFVDDQIKIYWRPIDKIYPGNLGLSHISLYTLDEWLEFEPCLAMSLWKKVSRNA